MIPVAVPCRYPPHSSSPPPVTAFPPPTTFGTSSPVATITPEALAPEAPLTAKPLCIPLQLPCVLQQMPVLIPYHLHLHLPYFSPHLLTHHLPLPFQRTQYAVSDPHQLLQRSSSRPLSELLFYLGLFCLQSFLHFPTRIFAVSSPSTSARSSPFTCLQNISTDPFIWPM